MGAPDPPWEGAILRGGNGLTDVSCAKAAEPIEMPFGIWTPPGPRKYVLDDGAHCRHVANMIESSVCATMRPFCRITLTTCST